MNQVEVKRRRIQHLSYCLACVNIWIFGRSIGNNGLGYLAAAILFVACFWIITGKNVPDRMARLLRGKNAKGQYRNAARMRRNVMVFQMAEGLLVTFLCMILGWVVMEKVLLVPYGSMILWILCPTLLLRCMQSAFLGYFQSEGSELPSAVSNVLRQVLYLGAGSVFLHVFQTYGEKVSLLLKKNDFTSMYGAMGIALGILISESLVLLFVFVIYRGSKSGRSEDEQGMRGTDSFLTQIRALLSGMAVDILQQLLLLLPLVAGLFLFQKRSVDIYASVDDYGIFIGRYFIMMLLLVEFFCIGILPGIAKMSGHLRKKEERYAKTAFQAGIQGTFVHGIFWAVIVAILANSLGQAIDATQEKLLTEMFRMGSSLVLWLLLSFYFSKTLRLRGDDYPVLAAIAAADVIFIVVMVLFTTDITALKLVISLVSGAVVNAVILLMFGCMKWKTWPDPLRTFAIPAGSACVCGLSAFGLEKIFLPHMGAVVTIVLELVITGLLYWGILLALHCFREQDLSYISGGKIIRAFGRLSRLL